MASIVLASEEDEEGWAGAEGVGVGEEELEVPIVAVAVGVGFTEGVGEEVLEALGRGSQGLGLEQQSHKGGGPVQLHTGRSLRLLLSPGKDRLSVARKDSFLHPTCHWQHSSPISNPLVCPSPSVSAWHSDCVHVSLDFENALPKSLRAPGSVSLMCPRIGSW